MAEHETHSAPLDDQAIAEALGTRPATVRDVAYGEGVQYSVGRGDARLEVFPRTGVTRLTTRDVRVELFGNAVADVSPGGVEFSRTQPGQDASLTVVPGGGIVFTLVAGGERTRTGAAEPHEPRPAPPPLPSAPDRAAETAQETRSDAADPSVPPPAVRAPEPPQAAGEPASPPAPGERTTVRQQQAAAEIKQQRVQLTGNLGRDPSFHTTPEGTLVARFPLGEHLADGDTRWHRVYTTKDRARQLQDRHAAGTLGQGAAVEVLGFVHVNTRRGKDGRQQKVREIYAVAVKNR